MRIGIPDILDRIVRQKRADLGRLSSRRDELERRAGESISGRRDFRAALLEAQPAIIAEIKRASPSKGLLAEQFRPAVLAEAYQRGGAAALSVLTDGKFFQGSLDDLAAARAATSLPVLRKDFTIDALHVIEAAAHGADAILLIAAVLSRDQLTAFRELAAGYGMASLVEVHGAEELETALASGARIIGVNNRNLHSFEVTIETSLRLAEQIPAGVVRVSESGIHSRAGVERLREAGYQAFLVGEHLMKSSDPAAALRALLTPLPGAPLAGVRQSGSGTVLS